jgi:hypothetical protein
VTPEIAARLRRGEDVSPEEIAAASEKAESDAKRTSSTKIPTSLLSPELKTQSAEGSANEWLPESITAPKKKGKGKKRRTG